jgi:hypothetical protein
LIRRDLIFRRQNFSGEENQNMRVKLTYYKTTGKYQGGGDFDLPDNTPVYEVPSLVLEMLNRGERPGLCDGPHSFHTLVQIFQYGEEVGTRLITTGELLQPEVISLVLNPFDDVDADRITCHLCSENARWEGWVKHVDRYTKEEIGLMQLVLACDEHAKHLVGAPKE